MHQRVVHYWTLSWDCVLGVFSWLFRGFVFVDMEMYEVRCVFVRA